MRNQSVASLATLVTINYRRVIKLISCFSDFKYKRLRIERFVTFTRRKLFCVDRPDGSSVSNSEVLGGLDSRQASESKLDYASLVSHPLKS